MHASATRSIAISVRTIRTTLLALTLAACGHVEPLRAPDAGSDAPLAPGPLARLTLNPGHDRQPTWLPDGSGLLYTAERLDRMAHDWCLELLPPTGGRSLRSICETGPFSRTATDAFEWAAVAADGRVAFVRSESFGGPAQEHELVVASLEDPSDRRSLGSIPFTLPGAPTFSGVAQVRWLDAATLVVRAGYRAAVAPCPSCTPDTVTSGRNLVVVALDGAPRRVLLAGTDYASSVAVRGPDEVFFTRGGDTRVYRLVPSSGAISVTWDFAPAVVRDVQVVGDLMAAVVGGTIGWGYDPVFADSIQRDGGGIIALVNLASGTSQLLPAGPRRFRHPALSPDGRRLVAESYDGRVADLYLFDLP